MCRHGAFDLSWSVNCAHHHDDDANVHCDNRLQQTAKHTLNTVSSTSNVNDRALLANHWGNCRNLLTICRKESPQVALDAPFVCEPLWATSTKSSTLRRTAHVGSPCNDLPFSFPLSCAREWNLPGSQKTGTSTTEAECGRFADSPAMATFCTTVTPAIADRSEGPLFFQFFIFLHFSCFSFFLFFMFSLFHFFIFSFSSFFTFLFFSLFSFIFSFFHFFIFLHFFIFFSFIHFSFFSVFSSPGRPWAPQASPKTSFFTTKKRRKKERKKERKERRRKKNAPTETGPLPQSHAQDLSVIRARGNPSLRLQSNYVSSAVRTGYVNKVWAPCPKLASPVVQKRYHHLAQATTNRNRREPEFPRFRDAVCVARVGGSSTTASVFLLTKENLPSRRSRPTGAAI